MAVGLMNAQRDEESPVPASMFAQMIGAPTANLASGALEQLKIDEKARITRGNACRLMFWLLGEH
jgi:hypothetical protein